jgi:hypothetical protein
MGLWDQRKLIHVAILKLLASGVGPDFLIPTHRRSVMRCPSDPAFAPPRQVVENCTEVLLDFPEDRFLSVLRL